MRKVFSEMKNTEFILKKTCLFWQGLPDLTDSAKGDTPLETRDFLATSRFASKSSRIQCLSDDIAVCSHMVFIRLCKDMGIRIVYLINYFLTICTVPYLPIYLKVFGESTATGALTSVAVNAENPLFSKRGFSHNNKYSITARCRSPDREHVRSQRSRYRSYS